MSELNTQAEKLKALGHPLRLKIVRLLTLEGKDLYLNEIANRLEINRALAKIHLNKLESAEIVKSRVVLVEGKAKALRFYELQDFDIHISPEKLKEEKIHKK
ncbi:MAG TPA: helix-turn-helix domain-containing protein [Bacteroidales bacterium]|nr:helix-turn-helix domain-containing protein [Bacteroidales bacterium]HUX95674.1 helix-turn-helix domain-containing protein [Bacteroidales bacterium]